VSNDIAAIVERARAAVQKPADPGTGGSERSRLEKVAQEFESMLLTQMLRDMRKSGEWEDEESHDTLGAETMYDTLDVELAGHLSKVQGLGLSKQLLQAFDRYNVKGAAPQGPDGLTLPPSVERNPMPSVVAPAAESSAALIKKIVPGFESLNVAPAESPLEGKVTSSFGWRHDPFTGQAKFHKGVDLRAAYGQDVKAAGDGRVVFSGTQSGYGTTVLIEHADGTKTRYAHLSAALVSQGDTVGAGQAIGQAGHSGRATGTHLHFEVIAPNGKPVDPQATRQLAARVTAQNERSGG
jgi:murein DD-endopeptidase MepM/ murein hydrolase activator NlpD